MPRYFFHLAGQLPAHDLLGHDCANDGEAEDHGSFIAHRIETEKPGMIREGNFISVTDEPESAADRTSGAPAHRLELGLSAAL
jgi:hypothetical protein